MVSARMAAVTYRGLAGDMAGKSCALSAPCTLLILVLLLSGCVLVPEDKPQVAVVDTQTLGLAITPLPVVDSDWWEAFDDPQLDALTQSALADNPSLAEALARVRSAQAQLQTAAAPTLPNVTLDGEEVYQRYSANSYIPPPFGGRNYWVGQVGANLNWDLDFWGRQADLIEQAGQQKKAAALDHAAAQLALTSAVTQAYLDLYRAYVLADIATLAERQRESLLRLTQNRVRAGLDTQLEIKTAEALLPQARVARLQAESARDLAVHRVAALSGRGADLYSTVGRPQLKLDAALPLPEQISIDLLTHRPDIVAALARVNAATAGREAARAAFYPDISLTAFAGYQSLELDELFNGSSGIWGFGPSIHLPLFDAQRLKAGYHGATAELDAAVAAYNTTVLEAVREVADQITLSQSQAQQLALSEQTLAASEAAYTLAQRRYSAGLISQIVVLNAESNVLDARRDVVSLRANLALARVMLLVSVGGTFNSSHSVGAAGAGVVL